MSTVVTVMNMKGGVGKTTVALHLAGLATVGRLTEKPLRVLAIDYDPQFNLSQALLPPADYFALEKARKTTLSILLDDERDLNPFELKVPGNHSPPPVGSIAARAITTRGGGILDLVPSTLDLMYVALGQANARIEPMRERFSKFIDEAKGLYDLIIIDCHPAGSVFTQTSLANSDHVIIPVAPQRYAVRGIGLMMEFIGAKRVGTNGPLPHILFNLMPRYGSRPEEADIRGDAKFGKFCLSNTLKKYSAFSEPEGGKNFVWYSKKPYSTEAYTNIHRTSKEVLEKIGIIK